MIRIRDNENRVVGTLAATPGETPTIDFRGLFPEVVASILTQLKEHEIITAQCTYDDLRVPDALMQSMEGKPILIFFYLEKDGFHVSLRRPCSDDIPRFDLQRSQKHNVKIIAKNDAARDFMVQMMGDGARAIYNLSHQMVGKELKLVMESECRPAGKMPAEMYQLTYKIGEDYTEHKTCTREELLDFVVNPGIHSLEITPV